ncbi:MAG: DUF2007 domain-containing protein [Rikenellaceae bacterium]|nr:DUF2007 domain-containing protein [Rikenellaceae bacterium]
MDDNRIVIGSFNSLEEAQIYKSLLESAGVEAHLQHDLAAQTLPVYGDMMDVGLTVNRDDQQRALEVLDASFDQDDFESESQAALCGNCKP